MICSLTIVWFYCVLFKFVLIDEDVGCRELDLKLLSIYVVDKLCSDPYLLDVLNNVLQNRVEVKVSMPHCTNPQLMCLRDLKILSMNPRHYVRFHAWHISHDIPSVLWTTIFYGHYMNILGFIVIDFAIISCIATIYSIYNVRVFYQIATIQNIEYQCSLMLSLFLLFLT